MENTLPVSGMEESCRQKSSRYVDRIINAFDGTTTDEEKFEALVKVFDGVVLNKALSHITRIKNTFNQTTTDEQKFDAFLSAFDRVAKGTDRCRENFIGENYQRWVSDRDTAEMLKNTEEEGVVLLKLLHAEMEPLISSTEQKPLSSVNGTSVKFAQCAKTRISAAEELIRTEGTYCEKILHEELPVPFKEFLRQLDAKLEAKLACLLAPFLFIPETIWS